MEKGKEKNQDRKKNLTRIVAIVMVAIMLVASCFTLIYYLVNVGRFVA